MPNIPTIPGSARAPDVQIGVKRDDRAQLQALGGVRKEVQAAGYAVDSSMDAVADYEQRKRKAEEAATFNESSIKLMKATSTFRSTLKQQPDSEIVPNWTGTATQVKQGILDEPGFGKMSPVAQRQLRMHLDSWQGSSTAEFQVAADKLGSQRRKATAVAATDEFLRTGDEDMMKNATAAIGAAVKAGDMTKAEADMRISKFPETLQKNQILNGIDNDAYKTLQDINGGKFKNVPEKDLNTLRVAAERQVNFVQKTSADDVVNAFQQTGIPKEDKELQDMKKAGKITGEFIKQYGNMVAKKNLDEARNQQSVLMMMANDMDLTASDNPEKDVREIRDQAASLPADLQKPLVTLLDNKLAVAKRRSASEENPVHQDIFSRGKESFKAGLFRPSVEEERKIPGTGWFGSDFAAKRIKEMVPDEDAPKTAGAAAVNYAKWQDGMRQFFTDNPKAGSVEAEEYSQKLMQPHVDVQVQKALNPEPHADTTRSAYEKLGKGETYWWNGKQLTKQ